MPANRLGIKIPAAEKMGFAALYPSYPCIKGFTWFPISR